MKIINRLEKKVIIEITDEELYVLSNALNEICNGIEVFEFETRIGMKKEEVKELLDKFDFCS